MTCKNCGAPIKYSDCGPDSPARYDDSELVALQEKAKQLQNKLDMWYKLNDIENAIETIQLLKHYIRQETKIGDTDFRIIPVTHINHPEHGTSYVLAEISEIEEND